MTAVIALVLVVRVFDRSGLSPAERISAVRTADAILRQADVGATWVDCSKGSSAVTSPGCTAPLTQNELVLRITKGPRLDVSAVERALGYSLVEPEAGGGTLGTVFSDRVSWLSGVSHSSRPVLLGRAIAHEIGHLLIGTNEHATAGLMRAVWTADDLRKNRPEDWVFTVDDRTRLHNSRLGADAAIRMAAGTPDAPAGES
jgi:hypothetical protein